MFLGIKDESVFEPRDECSKETMDEKDEMFV